MLNNRIETTAANTGASESSGIAEEAKQVVCELESVVAEIGGFLDGLCDSFQQVEHCQSPVQERLSRAAGPISSTSNSDDLSVDDQLDFLEQAWLKLEAEQRELLQMQEGLSLRLGSAHKDNLQAASMQRSTGLLETQQTAVQEFERLRREMQGARKPRG